jgi:hypothetical protein
MKKLPDVLTSALVRASDILFVQNPKGTSVGAFLGVAVDGLLRFFSPAMHKLRDWVDPEKINVFYWIAIGIVLLNIPHLLRRRQLPNQIEDAFEVIRRMKKEGAPAVQIKMQLLALCTSVIDQVKIDQQKLQGKARAGNFLREKF